MSQFSPNKNKLSSFILNKSAAKEMGSADDPLIVEGFLHLPPFQVHDSNPTYYQRVIDMQRKKDERLCCTKKCLNIYFNKTPNNKEIICYVSPLHDKREVQLKITLTDSMIGLLYNDSMPAWTPWF